MGTRAILGFNARVLFFSGWSLFKATTTRKPDSGPETCQHFSHTFPKALPQTSAGCSVLGIIRGYKLRTCPSDRAIGAQPKGATSCVFLFGLLFEVFFLPTAAGPCGAEYKHTVHSASAAPTWRTAPGPWGPNERRPQCKLRQGGRNRPRLRLSARFTGLSAPN